MADIYELDLHASAKVSKGVYATRVPGGWVYTFIVNGVMSSSFVPLTREPLNEKPERRTGKDGVKYDEVDLSRWLQLWRDSLPGIPVPPIEQWTRQMRASLRGRWFEAQHRSTWDYWEQAFQRVNASDYLTGRTPGKDGVLHQITVSLMLRPDFLPKLEQGVYDNKNGGNHDSIRSAYERDLQLVESFARSGGDAGDGRVLETDEDGVLGEVDPGQRGIAARS